jgi:ribosome biogenesis GTPase
VEDGCAVQAAIRDGSLDPERGDSYQKLRAEVAFHERKTDILAAQETKRRWKNIHKAMRGFYRGG